MDLFFYSLCHKQQQKKTLFVFIHVELWALLISGPPSCVHNGQPCKSQDFNLYVERMQKKILNHKANISKTDPVTLFFGCKKLLNSKCGMHGQNGKKILEWKVSYFYLSKVYSTAFFNNFPVSCLLVIKRLLGKKYGVTGLVFKIDQFMVKGESRLLLCNWTVQP